MCSKFEKILCRICSGTIPVNQPNMRGLSFILYLPALLVSVQASFIVRSAEDESDVVTWTKPGARFRARSVTVAPSATTVTEVTSIIPTATFQLRSAPSSRTIKRAFLNGWSFQGCVDDNDNLPPMVSPFPYQLLSNDVSGASCMDFCDHRGNSLAATQNGNECWCGEPVADITYVDKGACNVPCAGEPGEMCGGNDKLSVYAKAG